MPDVIPLAPSEATETFGWDTVYAVSYADVNAAIAAGNSSPASFTYASSDGDTRVSGSFGAWRVTTGGAGADIQMALPLRNARVQITSQNKDVTHDAVEAIVQVRAEFLPQSDGQQALQLATGEQVAEFTSFNPPIADIFVSGALELGLMNWLNDNLQSFNHAFAVVDLAAQIDQQGWEWMRPTHLGYAVGETPSGATEANSVFAVLTMTENRSAANLAYQVSPYAIPPGARSAYLISAERFIEKMVYPGMPAFFQNSPPLSSFQIQEGTKVVNTADMVMESFTLADGKQVNPTVGANQFEVFLRDVNFVIHIAEYKFSHKNADFTIEYTDTATLAYIPATQRVTMISNPVINSTDVEMKSWVDWVSWAATVVIAAVSAVLGGSVAAKMSEEIATGVAEAAAEGGAVALGEIGGEATDVIATAGDESASCTISRTAIGTLCGFLIGAVPAGVVSQAPKFAQNILQGQADDLPTFTPFATIATGSIHWPSGTGLSVHSVQINGPLQIGLNPQL